MRFTFGISFPNLQILLRQGLFCNPHNSSSEVPGYSVHMDIFYALATFQTVLNFFLLPASAGVSQPALVRGAA